MEVHVVSKTDNQEHAVAVLDSPEVNNSSLSESSVRVRPLLISLTSNNLSYARAGDFLHWWDTYPVPAQLPAPYNDRSSWGIVPAWGYGVVTESTTDITPGTLLWGFWPTASMPVSLRLQRSEPAGHWTEISESRQRLMTIYNAYIEEGRIDFPDSASGNRLQSNIDISSLVGEEKLNHMSWISLFRPVWQTGYLLSRHTFTSSPASRPPIHPLGMNLPWTAADADISASAVVSLSASGKTARSFAYNIFQRSAVEGPVGFLQVSQTPEALDPVAGILGAKIPTKAVRYDQAGESMEWIGNLRPERIVIVDFGARVGTLAQLVEDIRGHSALEGVKTTIVKVGSEQKVSGRRERKTVVEPEYLELISHFRSTARAKSMQIASPCRKLAPSSSIPRVCAMPLLN